MIRDIENNWDEMSKAYEGFTESKNSYSYAIEWPCIQKLLPKLNGKQVLDLGCGTGRFSFLLEEEQPHKVLGIDISAQMLSIAMEKAKSRESKVEFIQGDICKTKDITKEKFDFIFSSTTFHYISNLQALFESMYQLLSDNGTCIISVMHPVYTAQYPIDQNGISPTDDDWEVRYLDKSERAYIQPWIEYNDNIENYLSRSYHHTISDYFNAIISAGFQIKQVEEPYPPEEWKQTCFGRYQAFINTPSFLILKLVKNHE